MQPPHGRPEASGTKSADSSGTHEVCVISPTLHLTQPTKLSSITLARARVVRASPLRLFAAPALASASVSATSIALRLASTTPASTRSFSTTRVSAMPPLPVSKAAEVGEYDLFVIGGGSGGLGCARRAASYGAKVGLVEASHRLGGTCVNVGCVPKKVMWYTSEVADALRNAASYGFGSDEVNYGIANSFEWPKLKAKRDAYIHRLNGIYDRNLAKDNVDYHEGFASFIDANTVEIKEANGEKYTVKAKTIVVSVGGRPTLPTEEQVPGAKYGMDSDGFFDLETQPKRVAVVGAGYIAVELAGVFNGLGSDTHLFIRYDAVLRTFDPMLSEVLVPWMEKTGMHIHKHSAIPKIEKTESGTLLIHQKGQDKPVEVDALVWAIGRHSNIDGLGLDKVGVKVDNKGDIVVDEWQATNVPNIFAIGDVQGKALLTPVAIAAGRRLSNRLYGGPKFKDDKLSYEDIPSVVFSHPTIGSVGLSEPEAREKYGDAIKVYKTQFRDMSGAMLDEDHKQPTAYKLVCLGEEERVIGLHLIGKGSDEVLQGFAVAIKAGATRKTFQDTVAIHPTSAEEIVTIF
ncbi:Glutathione reductase [Apiotrichum porosum]|uniref:Glutathione reductase n=1 Tax=Apiotrichum porosum TaxID=105984 RepID=A0A427YA23_9TREE|nr:Glutathione reductase [Apiotrichum porosum]RSH88009.1 Glutathione reductase [Apiotrichum porosum]